MFPESKICSLTFPCLRRKVLGTFQGQSHLVTSAYSQTSCSDTHPKGPNSGKEPTQVMYLEARRYGPNAVAQRVLW